jgi:DNA-binding Lrp family transcriptional regulator
LRRRQETVLKEFQDIQNAKEAYSAYGAYDIVARIEAETMDKLKAIVLEGTYGDLKR